MNILVCLKMVSRATYTDMLCSDDASDDRLSGGAIEINPADAYALETALKLKDRYGAYVTVLSMSPMLAEPMLRSALAMAADEAVLVCDRIFAGLRYHRYRENALRRAEGSSAAGYDLLRQ